MNLFKKRNKDTVATIELKVALAKIERLYESAHSKQKSEDAKPTDYMRGLKNAYNIVNELVCDK